MINVDHWLDGGGLIFLFWLSNTNVQNFVHLYNWQVSGFPDVRLSSQGKMSVK